jgi:hypothetical protein
MTTKLDLQRLEEMAVPEGLWLRFAARFIGPKAREGQMVVQEDRSWED